MARNTPLIVTFAHRGCLKAGLALQYTISKYLLVWKQYSTKQQEIYYAAGSIRLQGIAKDNGGK